MTLVETAGDLQQLIEVYHEGIGEFMRGDCEPCVELLSRRDCSLGNPFGPWVRGFDGVAAAMRRTSPSYREGGAIGFDRINEYVDSDLAYIAELERLEAKVAGRDYFQPVTLRTTSIFHREEGIWKLVHRHVDTTNALKSVESVIEPAFVSDTSLAGS
jgi:ketosteroid isomerase-like protein